MDSVWRYEPDSDASTWSFRKKITLTSVPTHAVSFVVNTKALVDLGKVNAVVPDYLQDLRSHTVDGSHDLHIRTDYPDNHDAGPRANGKNGCSINYKVWRGDRRDNLFNVYAFTAEEYDVKADYHPLHVHVPREALGHLPHAQLLVVRPR